MTVTVKSLRELLFDLLSPIHPVDQARLSILDEEDWSVLMHMVRQHRLAPLLHWQFKRGHSHLVIPVKIRSELAQSFSKSTLRSLILQSELLKVHRILTQAKIPYIALKGAYLAYHAYPQAGLRPLRDLDILVPKELVLSAFNFLIEAGFTRIDKNMGNPSIAMQSFHHLPPLLSSSKQVIVELHVRLNFDLLQADQSDELGFWERSIKVPLNQQQITFTSPTDLLLHMIIHAVYGHEFDNGPLLLSDLAFLMATQPIDWDLFWTLAQQEKKARGCILALKLTQCYWDIGFIDWPSEFKSIQDDDIELALDVAKNLMLQNFDTRRDKYFKSAINRAQGFGAKFRILWGIIFPSKIIIASEYPIFVNDWRLYFWYPIRWRRQITERLPMLWQTWRQPHMDQEIKDSVELKQWLRR
jgi:hypothetical protein